MNSTSRLRRGTALAAVLMLALLAPTARAEQIAQFGELGSAPGFTFTNLGTAGGSIVGGDSGIFVDQRAGVVYDASLTLSLSYVGGNLYEGSFTVVATAAVDGVLPGDILLTAHYSGLLTGGSGSLSLNNVSTSETGSVIFDEIPGLVSAFIFTGISGTIDTSGPSVVGGGTASGTASFSVPIPEPATLLMLGLGLALPLVISGRRGLSPVRN